MIWNISSIVRNECSSLWNGILVGMICHRTPPMSNQDMEDALRALPELEQDIIEKYFLQRKTLVDIASDLDLPYDLLMGHLRAIKARLVLHV